MDIPITIIGGGVIGCAIAYQLSQTIDGIAVLERNPRIPGENQSSHNSGVIHAGIYYHKDEEPLKARLCVEGNGLLYEFCKKFTVPHAQTGKLVIATTPIEEAYVSYVHRMGKENGVPDMRMISGIEARAFEPHVRATAALHVQTSGIIEPTAYVGTLRQLAESRGAHFCIGAAVRDITPIAGGFQIKTDTETFTAANVINAAGLHGDAVATLINPESPYEIVPVRCEAGKFSRSARSNLAMNGMNVYPSPRPLDKTSRKLLDIPLQEFLEQYTTGAVSLFVGVHCTPTLTLSGGSYRIGDEVTVGPAPTPTQSRDDYGEPTLSGDYYAGKVQHYFPGITAGDISPHQVGILAKLKNRKDFVIERDPKFPNWINCIGIDSPGLTASLAIAKRVAEMVRDIG